MTVSPDRQCGHGEGSCRGFSLIELLVVIAVISILASLLLPGLAAIRERAWNTRCMSNLRQLAIAGANYAINSNGQYIVSAKTGWDGGGTQGVSPFGRRVDGPPARFDELQLLWSRNIYNHPTFGNNCLRVPPGKYLSAWEVFNCPGIMKKYDCAGYGGGGIATGDEWEKNFFGLRSLVYFSHFLAENATSDNDGAGEHNNLDPAEVYPAILGADLKTIKMATSYNQLRAWNRPTTNRGPVKDSHPGSVWLFSCPFNRDSSKQTFYNLPHGDVGFAYPEAPILTFRFNVGHLDGHVDTHVWDPNEHISWTRCWLSYDHHDNEGDKLGK